MKFLRSLLLGLSLSVSVAHAQTINIGSGITAPTGNTVIHAMGDDGHVHVPLQFGFPFYGKLFTNSVMFDNGVVGFFSPGTSTSQPVGCDPSNAYCGGTSWSSQQFSTVNNPSWNYMIAPLHTDLIPTAGSVYSTTGNANQMTYRWQNVGEYYNPSNLNTFSLQIKPSGFIGVDYEKINIGQSNVSIGLTGNLTLGEYAQHYWRSAGTPISNTNNVIPNWSVIETGGVDMCTINPLSSPTCAGYQAAYTVQQCTISALYDPSCPGYAVAYLDQQCSINPLFSQSCPGYAAAYLDQQCSINALYSTTCSGYASAYFAQQCSLDGLYDRACPNYSTAYATKMLLEQQGTASIVATAGVIAQQDPARTTINNDGTVSSPAVVSATGDSNVDKAIAPPPPSANAAAAPAAPVQLVQAPPPPAAPPAERKPEGGGEKPSSGTQVAQNDRGGDSKPAAPTARQELQARREAAAKAAAVESGKNLANEMGKAADMEAQKAVQNVVIQAMGFTPGFDAYGKTTIPDVVGYRPFTVYNNQKNIDNRNTARMFSGTDRVHNDIVESQYKLGTFGK
jgi:hypothetical protein